MLENLFDEDSRFGNLLSGMKLNFKEVLIGIVIGVALALLIMIAFEPWIFVGILNLLISGFILLKLPPKSANSTRKTHSLSPGGDSDTRVSGGSGKQRGRPKGSKNKPKEEPKP